MFRYLENMMRMLMSDDLLHRSQDNNANVPDNDSIHNEALKMIEDKVIAVTGKYL